MHILIYVSDVNIHNVSDVNVDSVYDVNIRSVGDVNIHYGYDNLCNACGVKGALKSILTSSFCGGNSV